MLGQIFEMFGVIEVDGEKAKKGIDGTVSHAESAGSKMVGAFSKAATAIGAIFAAGKIIDFGTQAVEAAASAKAIQSQFEQVFEGMESQAENTVNALSDKIGALPNRIKPAFNQISSFAKVAGMDGPKALKFTERAMQATADTAAFMDKSVEETTETLKSYLKGNYEVADNLGILSTETTRNAAATEMFGQKFKDLDGIQQQEVLLKMYEDANKVSGAMGQAAREADGYENVMGNLKQAWTDFLAVAGTPILQAVIPLLKGATGAVQRFSEWVPKATKVLGDMWKEFSNSTFAQSFVQVIGDGAKKVQEFINATKNSAAMKEFKNILVDIKDAVLKIDFTKVMKSVSDFTAKWGPLITGIGGAIAAFKLITGAIAAFSAISGVVSILGTLISSVGLAQTALTLLAPVIMPVVAAFGAISWPVVAAAAAIGALVAAGIWLWQNWETLGPKISQLWENIKIATGIMVQSVVNWFINLNIQIALWMINIFNKVSTWWNNTKNSAIQKVTEMVNGVRTWFSNMVSTVTTKVTEIYNAVKNWFGKIPGYIKQKWNEAVAYLKGINLGDIGRNIIQGLWNGMKGVWNSVAGWIQEKANSIAGLWKKALDINSPSKKMIPVGEGVPEGVAVGMEKAWPIVEKSIDDQSKMIEDTNFDVGDVNPETIKYTFKKRQEIDESQDQGISLYDLADQFDKMISLLDVIARKELAIEMNRRVVSEEIDEPLDQVRARRNIFKSREGGDY